MERWREFYGGERKTVEITISGSEKTWIGVAKKYESANHRGLMIYIPLVEKNIKEILKNADEK